MRGIVMQARRLGGGDIFALERVFGRPEGREKALWIIANRSMQAYAESKTGFGDVRKLPIYDDHEITPASNFRVIMVGLPTALYYRDLFVHRLGATTADRGFLLLVDGQVMTAFGIFIQDFLGFRTRYLPEMFGITRSSRRYHRLGKLFMLLLTSGEAHNQRWRTGGPKCFHEVPTINQLGAFTLTLRR